MSPLPLLSVCLCCFLNLSAADDVQLDLQRGHQATILETVALPSAGLLLTSDSQSICAWETASRLLRWQIPGDRLQPYTVADAGRTLVMVVGYRIELRRLSDGARQRSIGCSWVMTGDGARPGGIHAVQVTPDGRWVVACVDAVEQRGADEDADVVTRWFPVDPYAAQRLDYEPGAVGTDPPDDIEQPAREVVGRLVGQDSRGRMLVRTAGRCVAVPHPGIVEAESLAGSGPSQSRILPGGQLDIDSDANLARWRGTDGGQQDLVLLPLAEHGSVVSPDAVDWLVRDGFLVAIGSAWSTERQALIGAIWRWRLPDLQVQPVQAIPGTSRVMLADDLLLAAVDGPHGPGLADEPVHAMPLAAGGDRGAAHGTRLAWLDWRVVRGEAVTPQPFSRLPDFPALDAVVCDATSAWIRSGASWTRFTLADGCDIAAGGDPPARSEGTEFEAPSEEVWRLVPPASPNQLRNLIAMAMHPQYAHEDMLGKPFQWAWIAASGSYGWKASGTHLMLERPRIVPSDDGPAIETREVDLVGHAGMVLDAALTPDRSLLVTVGDDGVAAVWRLPVSFWQEQGLGDPELLYRRVRTRSGGWLAMAPDGTYAGSRDAIDGVLVRRGGSVLPVSQVELTHHRPDLLLARIGLAPAERIVALRRAWELRVNRTGSRTTPAEVEVRSPVPASTDAASLPLTLHCRGDGRLARIMVTVDGVPVPDRFGLGVGSPAVQATDDGRSLDATIQVPLAHGLNIVEVVAVDAAGGEGPARRLAVNRSGSVTPRLIIAAVGISTFAHPAFNLRHAASDARRMATAIAALPGFSGVETHLLCDAQATRAGILGLRQVLAASGPDDVVVCFLAGHGLLDDKLGWWFLTHDGDPDRPQADCVAYHEIEGLLDGIPAHRRLLLMDACHAGEVDAAGLAPLPGVQVRAVRGLRRIDAAGSAADAMLMRDTFVDLRRAAGAVVIAASCGQEVAYEDDRWQGGAFTRALLDTLDNRQADSDGDGALSAHEWRAAASARVRELTGGLQQPVQRADNPLADIILHRW